MQIYYYTLLVGTRVISTSVTVQLVTESAWGVGGAHNGIDGLIVLDNEQQAAQYHDGPGYNLLVYCVPVVLGADGDAQLPGSVHVAEVAQPKVEGGRKDV